MAFKQYANPKLENLTISDVEVDAKLIPETFRTKKPTKRGYNETFKEIRQVLYTQYGFIRCDFGCLLKIGK